MKDKKVLGLFIKEKIKQGLHIGSNIEIKLNLGRNKHEIVKGIITEKYDNHFIIKTKEGLNRSFSYVDILIKTAIIKNFNFT